MLSITPHESSVIQEVSYDPEIEEMKVIFVHSGVYYYKAPKCEFIDWATSLLQGDSAGSYYNDYIKGQFPCRKEGEAWPRTTSTFTVTFNVTHDPDRSSEAVETVLMNSIISMSIPVPGYQIQATSMQKT